MSSLESTSPNAPPVVTTVDAVREQIARARGEGTVIGLVPTMGALHAGHVSLIELAKMRHAFTVVSIFVNPTQFGVGEDLGAYPRTLDADLAACHRVGADLVFTPAVDAIYPPGDQTRVHPGPLANTLCGLSRPGHFIGVCTVVAKLFNIVQPDFAVFGQKDAQQALIIHQMAADLFMPIEIVIAPIVREADGLAMSSRNAYLSPAERARAAGLYRALSAGAALLERGIVEGGAIEQAMRAELEPVLSAADGQDRIEYLSAVNGETLEPIDADAKRVLLAGAVRFGKARLIDNIIVDLSGNQG